MSGMNKIQRFAQNETFDHVFQPSFNEVFEKEYKLKGRWAKQVFGNSNPIVLELGCGKGEYTVQLARDYKEYNYIGIDIKGARIWRGAKQSEEEQLKNVAFLRTRIEFLESFFAENETEEIWITFPDPQLKKRRNKKRITGPRFLNMYKKIVKDRGIIHVKTDNVVLYEYTRALAIYNNFEIIADTDDLYNSPVYNDVLLIKTFYEQQFLEQGMSIKYLAFRLNSDITVKELPNE
jgi:tRNA (guanine-N7-)-methyltransferase